MALQPLDVVKTRLQGILCRAKFTALLRHLQNVAIAPLVCFAAVQDGIPGPLSAYRGTVHALKSIVKEEGWRALYSGLGPGLLGAGMSALVDYAGIGLEWVCKQHAWSSAGLSWGLYFSAYNRAKERYQKSSGQTKLAPQLHLLSAAEAGCLVSPLVLDRMTQYGSTSVFSIVAHICSELGFLGMLMGTKRNIALLLQ